MEFVFRQTRVGCEKAGVRAVFVAKGLCGFATHDEVGIAARDGAWAYFEPHSRTEPAAAFVDDSATCLVLSYADSSDIYLISSTEQERPTFSIQFQVTLSARVTAADGELLGTSDGRVLRWSITDNKLELKDLATFDSEIVQLSVRKSLALASTRTLAKVFAILDPSNQYQVGSRPRKDTGHGGALLAKKAFAARPNCKIFVYDLAEHVVTSTLSLKDSVSASRYSLLDSSVTKVSDENKPGVPELGQLHFLPEPEEKIAVSFSQQCIYAIDVTLPAVLKVYDVRQCGPTLAFMNGLVCFFDEARNQIVVCKPVMQER